MTDPTVVEVQVSDGPTVIEVSVPGAQGPAPTVPKYSLNEITSEAGALDIPFDEGSTLLVTLTEDVDTLTFSGAPGDGFAQRLVVYIQQDDTGGWEITWPNNILWPSGGVPEVTLAANALDCFVFDTLDGGDTILAARAAADFRS